MGGRCLWVLGFHSELRSVDLWELAKWQEKMSHCRQGNGRRVKEWENYHRDRLSLHTQAAPPAQVNGKLVDADCVSQPEIVQEMHL